MGVNKKYNVSDKIQSLLQAVMPAGVTVVVRKQKDCLVELSINGKRARAFWVGAGWPRQVKSALSSAEAMPDIVVAYQVSPSAKELLASMGIGWVDEQGAAEIALGSILVSKSGRPREPKIPDRHWTPTVFAVAEALLMGVGATVTSICQATQLSTAGCVAALKFLSELQLLTAESNRGRYSARRVDDKDRLLDAYASAVTTSKQPKSLIVGMTARDMVSGLMACGKLWDKHGIGWAATGVIASLELAPFLTDIGSGVVYVDGKSIAELELAAARADLRPIAGGRLTLRAFPTTSTQTLSSVVDGLRVAPWPRVYVDLITTGVRGEEAAEHLLEVISGR